MAVYLFVVPGVLFTAIAQVIMRHHMEANQSYSDKLLDQFFHAATQLFSPPIILSICMTLIAGVSWMVVLSKVSLSQTIPLTLLTFPVSILLGVVFLNDYIDFRFIVGFCLMLIGLVIIKI